MPNAIKLPGTTKPGGLTPHFAPTRAGCAVQVKDLAPMGRLNTGLVINGTVDTVVVRLHGAAEYNPAPAGQRRRPEVIVLGYNPAHLQKAPP